MRLWISAPGIFDKKDRCSKCRKNIGIGSDGFFRVFKNENEKNNFQYYQKNSITLEQFYDNYIKEIYQNEGTGILKISKKHFENINKKIRGLSHISYRILSFILYSHLLFSEELGYIQSKDCQNYLPNDIDKFIDMINKNWEILEIELKDKKY